MKNRLFLALLTFVLLFPLALNACAEPEHVSVPENTDWLPVFGQAQNPDDIVMTTSGPSYAGNTATANTTGPLDSVSMVQATLVKGSMTAHVTYRAVIQSLKPAVRNNIVNVFLTGTGIDITQPGNFVQSLGLYTLDLPGGVTATRSIDLFSTLSTSAVLVLDISVDAGIGRHDFEIGLIVNDVDFGTLPCKLTVVD
jgi:hypothetical protein